MYVNVSLRNSLMLHFNNKHNTLADKSVIIRLLPSCSYFYFETPAPLPFCERSAFVSPRPLSGQSSSPPSLVHRLFTPCQKHCSFCQIVCFPFEDTRNLIIVLVEFYWLWTSCLFSDLPLPEPSTRL